MNILVIIPARGGSKGIPGKNIKLLGGKPLIYYAIDVARAIVDDTHICVSTDDDQIIRVVEQYGLSVPFIRPTELATDTAGSYGVLLQVTSPFRTVNHVREALNLYNKDLDMVVSVKETDSNPYYLCFEEDTEGMLHISKGDGHYTRRQDCPPVYEYNGAIYIINPERMKAMPLNKFKKRVKYVMDREHSVDLDTMMDWMIAEYMITNKLV